MSRIPATTSIQQPAGTAGDNDLRNVDLNEFLDLLITELQNQDPLDPMENSEILQQISQIREISATNNLSDTLDSVLLGQNMATASSLIGKRVTALSDNAESIEGTIDRVSVAIDQYDQTTRTIHVHVGEHDILLNNVREIVDNEASA